MLNKSYKGCIKTLRSNALFFAFGLPLLPVFQVEPFWVGLQLVAGWSGKKNKNYILAVS